MGGAARIAAQRKIFRSTASARAAGWEMTWNKISLRSARVVIERGIFIVKNQSAIRENALPRFRSFSRRSPLGSGGWTNAKS
jgi:hypothetical protein